MDEPRVSYREKLVRKRKTNLVYECIYVESRKNGIDDLICKAERETQG